MSFVVSGRLHYLPNIAMLHFQACDRLLAYRVDTKMKGNKVNEVLNRLHLAMPTKRDNKVGHILMCEQINMVKFAYFLSSAAFSGVIWSSLEIQYSAMVIYSIIKKLI